VVGEPVSAEIVRVIDGDTILVEASPWPHRSRRSKSTCGGVASTRSSFTQMPGNSRRG
jgi:endonuclease YncB( thermonuclease family)